jgi:hypothetical protein
MLFVGGLHRSGTTLLAEMLDAHPDISGLHDTDVPHDEGQHLQTDMAAAEALGGAGRFAREPGAHLTDADAGDPLIATRLLAAWQPFAGPGCRHIVEKSPPNLLRFRYLQHVFPDALMIAIVRHPVAVAHATVFWARTSIADQFEHWLVAHEQFESDRAHLDLLFVRYEDLVRDPAATLRPITDRLGVASFTPDVAVRTDTNDRYFRRYRHSRVLPPSVKNWRDIRRFDARVRALGYGYSLRDAASP